MRGQPAASGAELSRRHAYPVVSAGDDGTALVLRRNRAFQEWRGRPGRVRWTLGASAVREANYSACVRVGGANRISMASVSRGREIFAGTQMTCADLHHHREVLNRAGLCGKPLPTATPGIPTVDLHHLVTL